MSRQSHGRIQRVITGQANRPGPIESHERNVLAITRRIHTLERRRTTLKQQIAAVNTELKTKRRELRAVLQRDSSIETDENPKLAVAGRADAIDEPS